MKYLLFAYYKYYPSGGFNDLHSVYTTKEEANAVADTLTNNDNYDYIEIHNLDDIEDIIKSHAWIKPTKETQ